MNSQKKAETMAIIRNQHYSEYYVHNIIYIIIVYIYIIQKYKEEIGVPGWLNRLSI